MKTERLYYTNPYTHTWTATITDVYEKDDHYIIKLDKTAFYPEGGGQPSDHGTISGMEVLEVFEENNDVFHKVKNKPAKSDVTCVLDWQRRFDHMQQHTGQHLLSAICIEEYDAHTLSFHLGSEDTTIDLAVASLDEQQLQHIEQKVNEAIYANKEILTYYLHRNDLSTIPLHKIPDVTDENLRIVEIKDIDYSACRGTHVSRTGELGLMKLSKTEKQKGYTRLFFKCGMRAKEDYQEAQHILQTLSQMFSTSRSGILDRVKKLEQEQKQLQKELEKLKLENAKRLTKQLVNQSENSFIFHIFEEESMKDIQLMAKEVLSQTNCVILFASTSEQKVLLSHNGATSIHCGSLLKEHLSSFNGRGGGNDKQAQASFTNQEDWANFLSHIKPFLS